MQEQIRLLEIGIHENRMERTLNLLAKAVGFAQTDPRPEVDIDDLSELIYQVLLVSASFPGANTLGKGDTGRWQVVHAAIIPFEVRSEDASVLFCNQVECIFTLM